MYTLSETFFFHFTTYLWFNIHFDTKSQVPCFTSPSSNKLAAAVKWQLSYISDPKDKYNMNMIKSNYPAQRLKWSIFLLVPFQHWLQSTWLAWLQLTSYHAQSYILSTFYQAQYIHQSLLNKYWGVYRSSEKNPPCSTGIDFGKFYT